MADQFTKGGKAFDPTKFTNLQQGTEGFENFLTEQNIKRTPAVEPVAPVVEAPVAPKVEPVTPVAPVEPQIVNKASLLENIQKTATGKANVKANPAFIQGVAKFATGKAATAEDLATGGSVADVIGRFGIGEQIQGFGIAEPPTEAKTGAVTEAVKEPSPVLSAIDNLIAQKTAGLGQAVDTGEFLAKKQEAATNLEVARQAIVDKQLIDAVKVKEFENKPIPMSEIVKQQGKFTADEFLGNLAATQDYNNLLILSNLANGNLVEAQRINSEIADDNFQIESLKLDRAIQENLIQENEADIVTKQLEFERDLALDGYTKITPDQASKLDQTQVFSDPISGNTYLKPAEKTPQEIELEQLDLLSTKLGIEKQLLENELIGDDSFQTNVTTADGIYRITYDKKGNEINRSKVGDSPAGTKDATSAQYEAAGYASRIEQTEAIFDSLAEVGTGFGEALGARRLPEILKGEDRKRFEQAERNFINAKLRVESGAAIADSEFASARLQYIPQPGDGASTLKQKAENRATVLKSLKLEAGNALVGADTLGQGGVSNTEDLFN